MILISRPAKEMNKKIVLLKLVLFWNCFPFKWKRPTYAPYECMYSRNGFWT